MSANIDRAILLLNQSRFDLAEQELRGSLAENPSDAVAHAFLALCLAGRGGWDEAGREAGAAVRLAPDLAFAHFVAAKVLLHQRRLDDAEAAAREAIRLSPFDADNFAILAAVSLDRRDWNATLEAADRGLQVDPDHAECANLRAMALVNLGRKQEASEAIRGTLARDPQNAFSHANQGWTLLHQGDHKAALEHFREALRIDPELDWARAGIVEALKARHLLYRLMLRYFLWMATISGRAQWGVILGFLFLQRALGDAARSYPILWPVFLLLMAFVYLTWVADPLFNLMLRVNRFGRYALSRDQRIASNWVGLCVLGALVSGIALAATRNLWLAIALVYFAVLVVPISATFKTPKGWPRVFMGTYTAGLAALGIAFFLYPLASAVSRSTLLVRAEPFVTSIPQYFLLGAVLSTWISPALRRAR